MKKKFIWNLNFIGREMKRKFIRHLRILGIRLVHVCSGLEVSLLKEVFGKGIILNFPIVCITVNFLVACITKILPIQSLKI